MTMARAGVLGNRQSSYPKRNPAMACRAECIMDQMVLGTRADLPTFVSVSQSISLRVVCIQVIDAATATPRQEDRRHLPVRRQALPAAVASLALPVAAASLALAAAPLLRRLPDRMLPRGVASQARPLLSGVSARVARLRRPAEPLPLDAGQPVADPDEEMDTSIDAAIAALMVEDDSASPAPERTLLAIAGAPS